MVASTSAALPHVANAASSAPTPAGTQEVAFLWLVAKDSKMRKVIRRMSSATFQQHLHESRKTLLIVPFGFHAMRCWNLNSEGNLAEIWLAKLVPLLRFYPVILFLPPGKHP